MKIYLPRKSLEGLGGGWSFTSNFVKALKDKVTFVDKVEDCDIFFIPGPTLVEKDEAQNAKDIGKKIVLRLDNIPRNSRNRNTGTSRLYNLVQLADKVIYQSQWAKDFLQPFVKKDGAIILNGADTNIFKPDSYKLGKEGEPQYLYIRSSRDETKRWEKAWYDFQNIYFKNPKAHLWIVGKFSPENIEYNFDFFGGAETRYTFYGVVTDREALAQLYRSVDYLLLPFFADACSNTAIEAKLCGTKIIYDANEGGGTDQIMKTDNKELTLEAMGSKYLEELNSL